MVISTMSNIVDTRTLVFEGAKPNADTIKKVIDNRKEGKDQVVKDIRINTMYLSDKGLEKYLVTLLFTDKEEKKGSLFEEDGMHVQELNEKELEEEIDGDIELEDLDLDKEDL